MAIAQRINADLLLRARLRKGWTQLQVAERIAKPGAEPDGTAISRYERDKLRPTPATLLALATALDLTVDELLDVPVPAPAPERMAG